MMLIGNNGIKKERIVNKGRIMRPLFITILDKSLMGISGCNSFSAVKISQHKGDLFL